MDRDTLRLILIVLGALIIGAIFLFGNPERKAKRRQAARQAKNQPKASDRRRKGRNRRVESSDTGPEADDAEADPDGFQQELKELGELIARDRQQELPASEDPEIQSDGSAPHSEGREGARPGPKAGPKRTAPSGPPPEKIVTLFVLAQDGRRITGVGLLDAALKAGLTFGDMEIFHRKQEGGTEPVFRMANIAKPGHFDRTAWNTFETNGVALFLTLPGPVAALDAWDAMYATGQRLAELLEARLLDDQKQPLTRQRLGEIREEMREFDRRQTLIRPGD